MGNAHNILIEAAHEADLPTILNILASHKLPQVGLQEHLSTTLMARLNTKVIGSAGLELYGTAALLRSVAVKQTYRGSGLGHRLTQAALDLARQQGVTHVYLLTTTADKYFPRFGFKVIGRDQTPEAIQQSVEFTSVCPASAVAMELCLK